MGLGGGSGGRGGSRGWENFGEISTGRGHEAERAVQAGEQMTSEKQPQKKLTIHSTTSQRGKNCGTKGKNGGSPREKNKITRKKTNLRVSTGTFQRSYARKKKNKKKKKGRATKKVTGHIHKGEKTTMTQPLSWERAPYLGQRRSHR